MDMIHEANLEYEAEIGRNPDSIKVWWNYLDESKSATHEV